MLLPLELYEDNQPAVKLNRNLSVQWLLKSI